MASDGATQEAIAAEVQMSVKTLVRIYAEELDSGAAKLARAVLAVQAEKALDGNTTAARFVDAKLSKLSAQAASDRFAETAPGRRERRSPPLGKKEQAQLDAQTAGQGSEWGEDLLGPTAH